MKSKSPAAPFALRPIACCVMLACSGVASANPTGPQVAAGSAAFQANGSSLTVTNAPGTIINWQGFSIGAGEQTRFIQQSASSAVLNRVVGTDPSSLLGSLNSNGRVFLVNPHGIVVGAGARIDTAGFIASTLNISDSDFLQGRLRFEGGGNGVLRNEGAIRASGDIMLVGPAIENTGIIVSEQGSVLLAAGRKLTITSPDAQGVRFELQSPTDSALNVGSIAARSAATMLAGTLRHSGDIRAGGALVDETGRVTLVAQKEAIVDKGATISASGPRGGEVTVRSGDLTWVEGSIEARGTEGKGGTVQVLGDRVGLSGATIDASGETGGGTILVGGDYQGKNPGIQHARQTIVGPDAILRADAISAGDGGKVIVWADGSTRFEGAISARGGAVSGNGGLVETSGHETLTVTEGRVDTRAPAGHIGMWLLDPTNIVVSVVGALPPGNTIAFADAGVTTSVSATAINNATTDVTLQANTDIEFQSPVSIAASGVGLTAQAGRSIVVNQSITTNNGNVTLIANETVANGVVAADRAAGNATLNMLPGAAISAGTGDVVLRIRDGNDGVGNTRPSGDLTVANVVGRNVTVSNTGVTADARVIPSSNTTVITASNALFLENTAPGAAALIGVPAVPMLIDTPALEAVTSNGTGGIFISSPNPRNLEIGGVPASVYNGAARGVQTLAGGPIQISVNGNLTRFAGTDSTCGAGGGSGGPICANDGNITLTAASIGAPITNRIHIYAGTGTVTATSTVGGIFFRQRVGDVLVSRYNFFPAAGQPVELHGREGDIIVDANVSLPGSSFSLIGGDGLGGGNIRFVGPVTITASSLSLLDSPGAVAFNSGIANLNAPTTVNTSVSIGGGTANFNAGGAIAGGATLSSGALGLGAGSTLTLNGGALNWSGGTLAGTGSLALTGGAAFNLGGGGARVLNGPTLTIPDINLGGGSLDVQGGTLALPGTVTMAPTSTLLLSGAGRLDASGSALPRLNMTGGTLSRTAAGDLAIAGDFNVSGGGILSGAGGANFLTQGHTTLTGVMFPLRSWINSGTLDIASGGRMSPSPGGGFQFTNQPLATVNVTTNLPQPFGAANEAVVANNGTMNFTAPGAEAMRIPNAFTNAPAATLNVTAGTLDLQDARTISGNVGITGGTTLVISEFHAPGALFDGTAITGTGTVSVKGSDGALPQATFRNVTAANAALDVGINGTAIFDTAPSTFGNVSVAFAPPNPPDVSGVLTSNTGITINGTLAIGGSATFNGTTTVAGTVSLGSPAGGTLGGTGVFSAPSLSWTNGTISGAGRKTFTNVTSTDSGGAARLAGNVGISAGVWTNNGTLTQDGAGQLTLSNGATVNNPFGSNWNVSSSDAAPITHGGGTATTFNNAGNFSHSGVTPHTVAPSAFRNTGVVTVGSNVLTLGAGAGSGAGSADTGVISLDGGTTTIVFNGDRTLSAASQVSGIGGNVTVSSGTLDANGTMSSTGTFTVSGNGVANFNTPIAPSSVLVTGGIGNFNTALTTGSITASGGTANFAAAVTDTGQLSISSPGIANFEGATTVAGGFTESGGTLGGAGAVNLNGAAAWSGGAMTGAGTTLVNGGLAISGAGTKSLLGGRTLQIPVSQTATWTGGGDIAVGGGSTVSNLGTWQDQTPGAAMSAAAGGGTFSNGGVYDKSITSGTTTIGLAFNNSGLGSVNVQTGILRLAGGGSSSRPFALSGGLEFAADYAANAGSDITGPGAVFFTAGTATLSGGTYNVSGTTVSGGTANFNPAVSLVNTGAINVSSGTLALNSGEAVVVPTFVLSGGTLGGSDTVTATSLSTWSGGTMTGAGTTRASGGLNISGSAKSLLGGRTLEIPAGATATWSGGGDIAIGGGSTISNLGTWQDQATNAAMTAAGVGGTFSNVGAYQRAGGGTTTIGVAFDNPGAGSVDVQSGALRLAGGGSSSRPFSVTGGLEFAGTYAVNAGSDITGTGTVSFTGGTTTLAGGTYNITGGTTVTGGTASFTAAENLVNTGAIVVTGGTLALNSGESITAPTLNLSNGTLAGSDTIDVSGALTWSGGTMTGSGTTNANVTLALSGIAVKNLTGGRTLNNTGIATFSNGARSGNGALSTGFGATINNSGTWQDQTVDGIIDHALAGANSAFNNTGTYTKSVSGTTLVDTGVAFNNASPGQVQVQNGTLRLRGGGTSTGTLSPGSGGTLEFNAGSYDVTGGNVTGAGTILFSGATANISGGTYNMSAGGATTATAGSATFNAASTTNNVGALSISGTGAVTLSSGETVDVSALSLAAGTLGGTDTINVAGVTTWTGGTMTGSGTTNANGNATLGGSGTVTRALTAGRTFANTAGRTATWTGSGGITIGGGATIANAGTWADQSVDASITNSANAATFSNTGTYTKSVSMGTTTIAAGVVFNNTNAVNVTNGTLKLNGGGADTGTFNAAASGTVIEFAGGTHTLGAGSALNNAGSGKYVLSGGTLTANTAVGVSNFDVSGGTLNGSAIVTLSTAGNWTGGAIDGATGGQLVVAPGATLAMSGPAAKVLDHNGRLVNDGTLAWSGTGNLIVSNGSAISNRNLFDVQNDQIVAATSGAGSFTNTGTFSKTAGAGTTRVDTVFINTGTTNVDVGILQVTGAFPTNDGTINVQAGASFSTNGSALVNAGTIGGEGTLDLGGATLTNLDRLRPGAAVGDTTGTLTIAGNLTQGAAGRIDLELGGTASGAFDAVAVSGAATLTGTVNVSNVAGYTPVVADAFQVITAAARTGNFSTVNKTFATNMTAAYGNTGLQFTIGGGPVNTWISTSGDWGVGGNWNLGHAPGPGETALIPDGPGSQTITITAGAFAPDALTSNENLTIAGGTLALANASTINGNLALSNGALQGTGPVTVNGGFTFTGGSIGNTGGVNVTGGTSLDTGAMQLSGALTSNAFSMTSGTLTVANGGSLNLTGSGAKTIAGATLTNSGTMNIAGSDLTLTDAAVLANFGTLELGGAARIAMAGPGASRLANRTGGVINDRSSSATPVTGVAGTQFTNAGTFNKTVDAAGTQSIDAAFSNTAMVSLAAGTLALQQGGADTGIYALASGSTLDLAGGTRDFNSGTALTGAGTLRLSGAALNVNTPFTQLSAAPAWDLSGGVVNNATGIALNGGFTWSGGTFTGAGTLTTGTSAVTIVSGVATLSNTRWNNFGPVALNGTGQLVLSADAAGLATFDNRGSGVITDTTGSATPIGFAGTRARTSFANSGDFLKQAASAATQTLDVPMTSSGAIAVRAGTLVANGFPSNGGVLAISEGARFSTGGVPLTNAAGGLIMGTGTLDVGAATFTNNGTVAPADSPGKLTIAGNFVQGPSGRLEIDLAGPAQGVDYDLLQITGTAALDGTLALNPSPALPQGGTFDVITYAGRTGDFSSKTSPPGSRFETTPNPTFYRIARTDEARNDAATTEARFFATKDALVFNERFSNRVDPVDAGGQPHRDTLPECR